MLSKHLQYGVSVVFIDRDLHYTAI